jgi:hypothetical protein
MGGVESTDSVVFWIAVVLTCAICLGEMGRALLKAERLTEFPMFVGAMWFYFYGVMAVGTAVSLASYLPKWALEFGQTVALACFLGLVVGWHWGVRRRYPVVHGRTVWRLDPRRAWWIGFGLVLVGGVSFRVFLGEGDLDWEGTSAYWYLLFHVMYPGLALCLAAEAIDSRYRKVVHRILVAAICVFALYPHVVGARRGPLFPAVIVLLLVPPLVGGVTPRRSRNMGGLATAGFVMLLFVAVRPWLYEEGRVFRGEDAAEKWRGALGEVTAQDVFMNRVRRAGDNEFLYHCGMVGTIVEREGYQFGTGYLSLLTHWVPRQWWAGKPRLGQGMFPDAVSEIPLVMGWSLSAGASAGGVAEVFNQFGYASPIFWLLFGYALALLYRRAKGGDVRWQLAYVGIVCASHWLVSQGVAAAFVPACIYVIVPLVVLRFARSSPTLLQRATVPEGRNG